MKASSVACYSVSGFFLYALELLLFFPVPVTGVKLSMIGIFSIPVIVFIILGMALNGFENWQMHTGTVLVVSGLVTAMGCITMACVMNTKEFSVFMDPQRSVRDFDYMPGIGGIALSLTAGAWLVHRHHGADPQS